MRDSIEELQDAIILLEKLWVTRGTEEMFEKAKEFDEAQSVDKKRESKRARWGWSEDAEWYFKRESSVFNKIKLLPLEEKLKIKKYIQGEPLDPDLLEVLLLACEQKENKKMIWKKGLAYYENGDLANLFGDPLWDKKLKLAHKLKKEYEISFVKAMQSINHVFLNPYEREGKSYTEKIRKEVEWRKENVWNREK